MKTWKEVRDQSYEGSTEKLVSSLSESSKLAMLRASLMRNVARNSRRLLHPVRKS